MRIETICTGDELLTGLTADTNSRAFQALLLDRTGLTVRRSVVVGDVKEDIIEALRTASTRCDAVLVSGGLGPTADDITAECAAELQGVPLEESPAVWAHIEARFKQRGVTVTPNNRRQAMAPRGAECVINAEGSAPLIIQRIGTCTFFFVPGVPREYRHLVEQHVVPRLEQRLREQGALTGVRLLRLLRTMSLPESHLDALVRPLFPLHPHVTFGFRTHAPENHLKLLAEAPTKEEAQRHLDAADAASRALLGRHVFGVDDETLPFVVVRALLQKQHTLSTAESCTGGLISELITSVSGASNVFLGGAATYQPATKSLWARVPPALIERETAVSPSVARAMAEGMRGATDSTWSLSVTGYAGPGGGTDDMPVGTVFIGLAGPKETLVERHRFHGDRERVRSFAAMTALDLLRRTLETA